MRPVPDFLFALNTADAYLRTGLAENALVIGSEVLSKLVDWKDRGSCILFGDGAGAVVVERCRTESRAVEYSNALPETEKGMQETAEEKRIPAAGILGRALHSDGTGGGVLQCGARELTTPYARTSAAKTDQNQPTDDREHYIQMDGQEVYRFATRRVPQCIEEALSDAGLAVPDIDMFVLHQANARIIDAVAKRLHADRENSPPIWKGSEICPLPPSRCFWMNCTGRESCTAATASFWRDSAPDLRLGLA